MTEHRAHAILSASAAHRWLVCTPSARLEDTLPDSTSVYAEEGTLAHDFAALVLRRNITDLMSDAEYETNLKTLQAHELYQDEMLEHVNTYLEYVKKIIRESKHHPYVTVEVLVPYTDYVPEGFGTADCIIIGGKNLHIIDFKYGKGVPVSSKENPQMMLYALGALQKYSILYSIETVSITVFQPRINNISTWTLTADELHEWGEGVRPIAEKAFKGEGVFYPGDHCRFCRASSTCRARAEFYLALEGFQKIQPDLLSNDEIGAILERAQDLQAWIKDLQDYALNQCLSGIDVPGWKAVEGRSVRQWTDADKAFETLITAGVDEAMLYERKPLTLAATERILGKKRFGELVGSYVDRPPGRPTLAPETDKRQAITRPMAKDEFEKIN